MVLLKMLMEIALPKMGELLVMIMRMISPSEREVPPVESLRQREKCSCPSSASRRRRSIPKVLSLFFLGKNDLYTRRWAPEVGWRARRALVSCDHQVAPLRWLFLPVFLIYAIKIPRKVSTHFELCGIGSLT